MDYEDKLIYEIYKNGYNCISKNTPFDSDEMEAEKRKWLELTQNIFSATDNRKWVELREEEKQQEVNKIKNCWKSILSRNVEYFRGGPSEIVLTTGDKSTAISTGKKPAKISTGETAARISTNVTTSNSEIASTSASQTINSRTAVSGVYRKRPAEVLFDMTPLFNDPNAGHSRAKTIRIDEDKELLMTLLKPYKTLKKEDQLDLNAKIYRWIANYHKTPPQLPHSSQSTQSQQSSQPQDEF